MLGNAGVVYRALLAGVTGQGNRRQRVLVGVQLRTRRSYTAGDAAVGGSGAASVLQALELLAVE